MAHKTKPCFGFCADAHSASGSDRNAKAIKLLGSGIGKSEKDQQIATITPQILYFCVSAITRMHLLFRCRRRVALKALLELIIMSLHPSPLVPSDVHESDDPTKEALVFTAGAYPNNEPFQTTPGTPLGTGERFNLPPTTSTVLFEFSNLTAGQIIEISEVGLTACEGIAL